MAVKEMQFGDLIITFTKKFEERWLDTGSGADADVGFYHPVPPAGFYALGSIGVSNNLSPNDRFASICVKAANPRSTTPALLPPKDFQFIWNDAGSGADEDGSCWRPVPPSQDYVALGDVFVRGHDKPKGTQVMCVHKSLVFEAVVGTRIWIDAGSGADRDFGAWQLDVSRAFRDTPDGVFAVNSFVGVASHDKPASAPVAWTLRLPLPTTELGEQAQPNLTSRSSPPDHTNPMVDRIVTVPFTAVADADKTLAWQVDNSPFYEVQRLVSFDLLLFDNNNTSRDQTKRASTTTGVSTSDTETFSVTTGVSVTMESGVELGVFSSKVSATISTELGYSSSRSISVMRSDTVDAELVTPAEHSGALWVQKQALRVVRGDGSSVAAPLTFRASAAAAFVERQFPAPQPDLENAPRTRTRRTRLQLG
ncbi:Vps62-related protein [Myxococcus sp. RHST-1-4]|nr:Vps62-related protein [Myxococcus sp. RHSTA-1-4]